MVSFWDALRANFIHQNHTLSEDDQIWDTTGQDTFKAEHQVKIEQKSSKIRRAGPAMTEECGARRGVESRRVGGGKVLVVVL